MKTTIKTYRHAGPGFYAVIYWPKRREAVQKPALYGFDTREEAREEAQRRIDAQTPEACPQCCAPAVKAGVAKAGTPCGCGLNR